MSEPDQSNQMPRAKPLLSAAELVALLKSKGVTFNLCSEADAVTYLTETNNYLRAASYRKLFPTHLEGPRVGQYINLDFAYLIELSSVDRRLRETLLGIVIDVEHFAKIELLRHLELEDEDGYAVISDYLARRPRVLDGLRARAEESNRHDVYSGNLIAHYLDSMPVWVMLEVVDFGTFVDFWLFCSERWGDDEMRQMHFPLKSTKALRNACAHNSLLVHGLNARDAPANFPTSLLISNSLNARGMKNSRTRRAKLKNLRVAQIAAALWALDHFCKLPSTRKRHATKLAAVRRSVEGSHFSQAPSAGANMSIVSFFDFLWRLIDIWVPNQAE